MSTAICGVIYMSDADISKQVDIAFDLTLKAADNRIGIKMGGNVSEKVYNRFSSQSTSLLFEIMDDPISDNAEWLLDNDGQVYVNDSLLGEGDSLSSRLERIQTFLHYALNISCVTKILLDVDYHFFDDETEIHDIRISKFAEFMLELYNRNLYFVPTSRFIFSEQ
jgi:hypothetical protein